MLSDLQRRIASYGAGDKRWTLVSGPVGSGKTHAAQIGFLLWQRNYGGHEFGIITKGKPQMGSLLREFSRMLQTDLTMDEDNIVKLPGASGMTNDLVCFYGTDRRAEPRIRGFNLTGFFIDEATTLPFSLIAAANARCRVGDPRIILCTNPDGPRHPLKLQYFDQPARHNAQVFYSSIRDNPTVTQTYIDSLHASYIGHMLERMVNGRWAAATGLVYPHYLTITGTPDPSKFVALDVVVDVGESSVTHALLSARTSEGETWIIDECRHHHVEQGVLSEREMVSKIRRTFSHQKINYVTRPDGIKREHYDHMVTSWIVDPAALRFRQEMIAQGLSGVGKAYNDFTEGVEEVNHWIARKALRIHAEKVPHLMAELGSLVWDEKRSEVGDDVPEPTSDHGADALRYLCFTRMIHDMGGRKAWERRQKRRLEEGR